MYHNGNIAQQISKRKEKKKKKKKKKIMMIKILIVASSAKGDGLQIFQALKKTYR